MASIRQGCVFRHKTRTQESGVDASFRSCGHRATSDLLLVLQRNGRKRENRRNEGHDYHVIRLNVRRVDRLALPQLWCANQVVRASVPSSAFLFVQLIDFFESTTANPVFAPLAIPEDIYIGAI